MNLKVRCLFGILLLSSPIVGAQTIDQQVQRAYFDLLTRQWQSEQEVKDRLQQLSPDLFPEYQQIIELPTDEALLPWTYFLAGIERSEGGKELAVLCKEARKATLMLRRFHHVRLADPFSQAVVDTSQAVRRLQFFAIQEGDKVAEIGFGYGYILGLLALVYQDVEVYANELDQYRLRAMQKVMAEEFTRDRSANFHFLAGHPRSTNLEGRELDLIIMENVFHHIGEQAVFLQSMLKSLHEEGTVIVIEEFLGSGRDEGNCPDRMDRAVLENLFSEAGFTLLKAQELDGQYRTMLRFARKEEGHLQE
ncbi:MAG: class I SAM-dependent methyltransferase [Saprospiraceae bacterium]|nr:methyltransferase domain-containing protein [Lewinella sp.]